MPIELPDLPFAPAALEPHLSADTLQAHLACHRACVEELQQRLAGSGLDGLELEDLVRRGRGRLAGLAAEAWNHGFFWACLSPRGGGDPSGRLADLVSRQYGDAARFREEFNRVALGLSGPGWTWLVQRPDGSLGIVATRGASTPLTGTDTPLLACDLWEHAYWLDRQDEKAAYLDAFWKVVDWPAAATRLRPL
ncbi:superoxide dismutase [Pseudoxanthomonas suwonensis]|uniref:superoxide dismutase n=1 Tax=Pseudoxanthomonas suwonensis TaxID=314722 RepID=UPI00046545E9|nr:Fe-Mn family superoxide dismutase [Pseudoxanthomonas suwonensis]